MRFVANSNRRIRREWKDSFSVGIEKIDSQHRGLLDLINEIGDLADRQFAAKPEVFTVLNAMVRYAENHFQTEEGYLKKYGYPGLLQQKEAHEAFSESVFSMAGELEKASGLSLTAILLYLEDWYADHILGFDRGYKDFLAREMAEGAKAASTDTSE